VVMETLLAMNRCPGEGILLLAPESSCLESAFRLLGCGTTQAKAWTLNAWNLRG
jgi:hypothetical protein